MERRVAVLLAVLLAALVSCGGEAADPCPGFGGDGGGGAEDTQPGRDQAADDAAGDGGMDLRGTDGLPGELGNCDSPPFGFGCPCSGNLDCDSGYCVEGPAGFVCTVECFEDCPEGWFCKGVTGFGADLVFLCIADLGTLCTPCQADGDCGGGACVATDDGTVCTFPCAGDGECPAGFSCEGVPETEGEPVCLPDSGSCTCTTGTAGQVRPCEASNELGTCYGFEVCDPAEGWSACDASTPAEEDCNGLDDDCDGTYDEGLTDQEPCANENEFGTCEGLATCAGPLGWLCSAAVPAAESCDYVDNDCNGAVDEDFVDAEGRYTAFEHCGQCGTSCAVGFPAALSTSCDPSYDVPKCKVDQCLPGFYKLNDFQCVPVSSSLCEPCSADGSCSTAGAQCVELNDGLFCAEPCATADDCPPGYLCQPEDGSTVCVPETGSCSCDGTNLSLIRSCSLTWPPLPAPGEPFTACYGIQYCTAEGWGACVLPGESCDAKDNDCDGLVDEDFMNGEGKYVANAHCGACGNDCGTVNPPNATTVCDPEPLVPQCVIQCKPGFQDVNVNPLDGCECQYTPVPDVPDGADQNCDGVDGDITDAIFVAKNGDDGASGTLYEPLLTLPAAVQKAAQAGLRDVYVATGVYSQSVTLLAGVHVYGGYSSDFKQRDPVLYETVILGAPPTPAQPAAVTVANVTSGNAGATLDGFTVFGHDNKAPGASSYALYVLNCTEALEIRGNHIIAGDGGKGAAGPDGVDGTDGLGGGAGTDSSLYGSNSCNVNQVQAGGGGGAAPGCAGASYAGGKGGASWCPEYNADPDPAENGSPGQGAGAGTGGAAGRDSQRGQGFGCGTCNVDADSTGEGGDGLDATDGADGAGGAGCVDLEGGVSNGLWLGQWGGFAADGGPGAGGGGGGAGGGSDTVGNDCEIQIGATGGGGGSGGCPGTGGTGGTAGGGSFGLFVVFAQPPASVPVVEDNVIDGGVGGDGGDGGAGGTGGQGGQGGGGGMGGVNGAWCTWGGGQGGDGGTGGHGGGGGGGCGGIAYGIYAWGQGGAELAAWLGDNAFFTGAGGAGGGGGPSIGLPGVAGADGTAADANF